MNQNKKIMPAILQYGGKALMLKKIFDFFPPKDSYTCFEAGWSHHSFPVKQSSASGKVQNKVESVYFNYNL